MSRDYLRDGAGGVVVRSRRHHATGHRCRTVDGRTGLFLDRHASNQVRGACGRGQPPVLVRLQRAIAIQVAESFAGDRDDRRRRRLQRGLYGDLRAEWQRGEEQRQRSDERAERGHSDLRQGVLTYTGKAGPAGGSGGVHKPRVRRWAGRPSAPSATSEWDRSARSARSECAAKRRALPPMILCTSSSSLIPTSAPDDPPQSAHSVRSARSCPIVVRRAKLATQSSDSIFIMVAQLRAVTSSRMSLPMCSNSFPPRRPSGLHT